MIPSASTRRCLVNWKKERLEAFQSEAWILGLLLKSLQQKQWKYVKQDDNFLQNLCV